jgi:hypothetical protein
MLHTGTMESFVKMINEDSINNEIPSKRQNLMWWIDITTNERSVSLIRRIKTVFGLSDESEPMFLQNNFNVKDTSRYMTGVSKVDGKPVHSASLGIQTMWLSKRPVVELSSGYLNSRLNFMYNLSNEPDHERQYTLSYAEGVAQVRYLYFNICTRVCRYSIYHTLY